MLGSCVIELFRNGFIIINLSLNYPMVMTMVKCIVKEWSYLLYLYAMHNSDYIMYIPLCKSVVVRIEIELDSL
jgi:hypothetical protein